jgi:peroxiredoxin family protein
MTTKFGEAFVICCQTTIDLMVLSLEANQLDLKTYNGLQWKINEVKISEQQ